MEIKTFRKGGIVCREGDPGDCMYDVYTGKFSVFADYGTKEQKLLMDYYPDQFFGEMGLLDQAPRSATVVAMEDESSVGVVSEKDFGEFFAKNPQRVLMIMQQMSHNLRRRTDELARVCRSIKELSEKEGK